MTPRQVVEEWVRRFNSADIDGLAQLYAADAVNHQVVMAPLRGREAIREMFAIELGRAQRMCLVENLFESGDWAILEWRDPNGLRGCVFFQVKDDQIVFQRGYFDQLSFFKLQGMPVPNEYLEPVKANPPEQK
jgi:limonene-1,2-epoxide hydrolase